jgi:hypothetical protein
MKHSDRDVTDTFSVTDGEWEGGAYPYVGMPLVGIRRWGLSGIVSALFLVLALFAFPLTASAHASYGFAGSGRIYGQLRDGTAHNAPVAGQSVTLQVAQGSNAGDLATMTTNAQGMFSFSGLSTDKTYSYAVYTLYQNAQYLSNLIDLSSKPAQQVNLTVYDATTSASRIAILQANILIDHADAQHGLLTVSESYFFENLGQTTYVGALAANGQKPDALLFSLPRGAQHLSLKSGFDGYHQAQVDGGFASDAAIPPGISQFAFSFQVSYSSTHYDFGYTILYPTVSLSALLPLDYHASSAALVSQGTVTTSGQVYQELSAQQILAHAQVHIELDGLPSPAPAVSAVGAGLNLPWLILIVLAMLAIVGLTSYIAARARRRAAGARLSSQKARRATTREVAQAKAAKGAKAAPMPRGQDETKTVQEMLLAELLELDKSYEAGTIKKVPYEERRAKLKARLRAAISEEQQERVYEGL